MTNGTEYKDRVKAFDAGYDSHRTGETEADYPGYEEYFRSGQNEAKYKEFA